MLEICSDLYKTCLKIYYFLSTFKKGQKWPNGQTILFLANSFKKGQIRQIWPLKGKMATLVHNSIIRRVYFNHFSKYLSKSVRLTNT